MVAARHLRIRLAGAVRRFGILRASAARCADDLADLRATVAALQAEVGRLRRRRHLPRRAVPLILAAFLVAVVPLATLAGAPGPSFSDLSDAAPAHRADITAIGAAGISTGYADPADPTHAIYDPRGVVTREQMASFLARTAGLGSNPPIANAATAQTVPDGSVTAVKLNPQGTTTGQVLTVTNSGVAWQAAPSSTGPGGPQGAPGTGVTTAPEPPGANCATGGARFTAANGATYACNGAQGPQGLQGPPGTTGPVAVGGVVGENPIIFTAGDSNFQTLVTATLTAPSGGYVLVTATTMVYTGLDCPCESGARIRHNTANAVIVSTNATTGAHTNSNPSQTATLAQTWVFPVAAGENTFSFEGSKFTGTGEIVFDRARITALFVTTGP